MNPLNCCMLEGTMEGELDNGRFPISVRRHYKDGNVTCHFECVCSGKVQEFVVKYGAVGKGVRIVGRLHQEKCFNDLGLPSSRVVIIVEKAEFRKSLPQEAQE